jgi:quercetin 2,3-dioxygenase
VSNLETSPDLTACRAAADNHAVVELFAPREVPLGGIRGIRVERMLPQRELPTVGAWCFLDSFGPHRDPMRVLPHPHIGLQTVTWPLAGEIRHRDSLGTDVLLRPGQLNLMTGGHGVSHSEFSPDDGSVLSGLQLWLALPADRATAAAAFEQHLELPRFGRDGLTATVFVGTLGDAVSPAAVHTPLVGAELSIPGGTSTGIPLRADFEHALLAIEGSPVVAGVTVPRGRLLYLGTGRTELPIATSEPVRAVLLGGEPFPDELVMWWNFVGRDHEEILAARTDWEAGASRFGVVPGHGADRVPAPPLPNARLTPRRRARPG